MIALAVTAAILGELCGEPPPAAAPDHQAATRYVEIGDAERAAGHARTAAVAYRAALAREAGNEPAKRGLAAVCQRDAPAPTSEDELTAGIERFKAGDLGEARRHLDAAARGEGAAAAGAHFFLGVIALRSGERAQALRELGLAAADPGYAEPAAELRRLARRQGRVSLSLLVAAEWDSNVRLLPEAPPTASSGEPLSDGRLLTVGAVSWRPLRGVSLSGSLAWRKHQSFDELDLLSARGQLSGELARGRHRLGGRGEADVDLQAGETYGTAQEVAAWYAWERSPGTSLGTRYSLRRRVLDAAEAEGFTGAVHALALSGSLRLSHAVGLGVELEGARELTRDPLLESWTAAATAEAQLTPGAGLRLTASASLGRAWFDVERRDVRGSGSLEAEIDLHDHLALVAGVDLEREVSTDAAFRFTKLVLRAGVAGYLGLP